jgi:hypothetical protein
VLYNKFEQPAPTSDDEFAWETVEQLKMLDRSLPPADMEAGLLPDDALPPVGDGRVYRARIFRRDEHGEWLQFGPAVFPRANGKLLTEIPFDFAGARTADATVDKPPLDDAVTVNIGHYRNSAAHEHGLFFTANPMAYLFGYDPDRENAYDDEMLVPEAQARARAGVGPLNRAAPALQWKLGSSEILVLKSADAKAGVLSARAEDLGAVLAAMDSKRDEMVAVVGRILAQEKKAAEAARTEEIRREGERGALTTICRAVGACFTRALARAQAWMPDSGGEVKVELPTEFFGEAMTADDMTKIADLWIKYGLIAKSDTRKILRRGRVIDPDRTDAQIDAELSRDPIPTAPTDATVPLGLDGGGGDGGAAKPGAQPPPARRQPPGGGGAADQLPNAPPRG